MKVLVANRGEIACRVLRTLRELGVPSVALYSDIDREAPHVWLADEAVALGEPLAYLDQKLILEAAEHTGATAVHPGYGFLSENAGFARACAEAGLVFIGPPPQAMEAFADKRGSRLSARKLGVPVIPGAEQVDDAEAARAAAEELGYPVLIKAAGGGGGKGMRRVDTHSELPEAFAAAKREAQAAFKDPRLLVEKLIHPARHVEVQVLADGSSAIALGERECSLQRRYQKLVEESPSPGIDASLRAKLCEAAVKLVSSAGYASAGTVEFLVGPDNSYYFLEVNARLQVEHPVTELRCGWDLVAWQLELAQGAALPPAPELHGHAIEVRLNAEDAWHGFLPQSGRVLMLEWPHWQHLRIDTGLVEGLEVSSHYDPLIAKVIAFGASREEARRRLVAGLRASTLLGVQSNQAFLIELLESEVFKHGDTYTSTIESQHWHAPELPEPARIAAEQLLGAPAPRPRSDAADTDGWSPWQRLGPFRLGGEA